MHSAKRGLKLVRPSSLLRNVLRRPYQAVSSPKAKRRRGRAWAGMVALLIFATTAITMFADIQPVSAATGLIIPDGDVTRAWTTCSPSCTTSHFTAVDDGASHDGDSSYIQNASANADEFSSTTITGITSATSLKYNVYYRQTAVSGGNDNIGISLRINGTIPTGTNCTMTGVSATWSLCTLTYSGTYSQGDLDSVQMRVLQNLSGAADTIRITSMNVEVTYTTPTPASYTQGNSRWFSNANPSGLNTSTGWQTATTTANWGGGREYGGTLSYNGKLWAISGWNGTSYNNDVSYSSDGVNWTTATTSPGFTGRNLFGATVFAGKMWVMGGFDGSNRKNDVWSSTDGVTWTQVTAGAAWSGRQQFAIAVYGDKMWVMGGYNGAITNQTYYSSDGATWTLATTPGWAARQGAVSVVYNNRLWIMGGNTATGDVNNVWYTTSATGASWTQATAGATWSVRNGFSLLANEGKMWLYGGENGATLYAQVYSSTDGITWTAATAPTWSARSGTGVVLLNGKVWVVGGKISGTAPKDVYYSLPTNTVGTLSPMAAQNVAASTPFGSSAARLRMNVGVSAATASKGTGLFQLQYALLGSDGACDTGFTGENYYPVGSPDWSQKTASAGWTLSNHAAAYFRGKHWVMGGDSSGGVTSSVYSSADGANWSLATSSPGWSARAGLMATVFNDKLWVMGGVNGSTFYRDVWSSSDGITWTQATATAGWSARALTTAVVFNNKMWIMGGNINWTTGTMSDVWSSSDGITWTQATATAGWASRTALGVAVQNNKLWVMGGVNYGGLGSQSDVWSSSDGITWTRATPGTGWGVRASFAVSVVNEKFYLMGGDDGTNSFNDVWMSVDGENWTQQQTAAGWSARGSMPSVVKDNQIWLYGGSTNAVTNTPSSVVWFGGPDVDFNNNSNGDTVAAISTMTGDPTGTGTIRPQSYLENAYFTNDQASIASGENGVWDFSLVVNGAYNTSYCIRAINAGTGANLGSYSSVPMISSCASPSMESFMRGGKSFCGGGRQSYFWSR